MRHLPPHARMYMVLVVLAGYLALGQLFQQAPSPSVSRLVVLLLLAVTCGPLKLRLPRLGFGAAKSKGDEPRIGVWLLFVFAALMELPARYAAIVSMAAVISEAVFAPPKRARLAHTLFQLSATNLSLLLALDAYGTLQLWGFGWTGALMAAALIYFLTHTWSQAAAVSFEHDLSVTRTWIRDFLPTAPVYGVLAGGGAIFSLLFQPSYLHTFVLLFPVISLCYYCYEFYFGRLRAERERAREVSEMHRRTVEALALAIDAKDRSTSGHLWRVQRWALAVARRLHCPPDDLKALEYGALLHDIGKIAVPEHLLLKPAKLTRQEFSQIAIHPQVGAEILAAVRFPFPVAELVHSHHENWDGSGYPRGLRGEQIPLSARVLTVVDCLDALISDRPYRPALPTEKAAEIIRARSGTTFDPAVVEVVLEMLPEFVSEIQRQPEQQAPRLMLRSPRSIDAVQTSLSPEEQARAAGNAAEAPPPTAEFLRRVYHSVGDGLNSDDIVRAALAELRPMIPHDAYAVFLADGSRLRARTADWTVAGSRPPVVNLWEGPTGWVAARAETLVNANPAAEAGELGRIARLEGWRDALIVPLWSAGRAVGTLNFYSKAPAVYTSHQARHLELMTANLGISLLRAAVEHEPAEPVVPAPPAVTSTVH